MNKAELFGGIILILVGWLVGLLSTPLSNWIEWNLSQKKEILKAIKLELVDNRYKLILIIHYLTGKHFPEQIDKKYIDKMLQLLTNYRSQDFSPHLIERFERCKNMSISEVKKIFSDYNETRSDSTSVKAINFSYIKTKTSILHRYNAKIHSLISEILFQENIFSQEVDEYRFFYRLTFDSTIEENNIEIVKSNIKGKYSNIIRVANRIISKTDKTLEEIGFIL